MKGEKGDGGGFVTTAKDSEFSQRQSHGELEGTIAGIGKDRDMKETWAWKEGKRYSREVVWRTLWRKTFGECKEKEDKYEDKRGGRLRRERRSETAEHGRRRSRR